MFWKRIKIITTIGFAIGILLTTNIAIACPAGQVLCGTHGCCECNVSFTTENETVKCGIDVNRVVVICSISEFSNITAEFSTIPSLQELDTALTAECGNHKKCAEKFQCQKHGGCPIGFVACGSSGEFCC